MAHETKDIQHKVSVSQETFLTTSLDYTLFNGGIGSGKTHAGALWAMLMALTHTNCKGLITANSYSQLKKATVSKFLEILRDSGVRHKYKSQDGIIDVWVGGGKKVEIFCISMEKFDLLRGIEVGWAWSDECAFYREEAFDVLIGRIRDRKGPCQWKGTTTPNGYNWLYKRFVEKPMNNSTVVRGKTSDNLENLGESYYLNLLGNYDPKLARQELDGEFINLSSGKVYYAFDRNIHVKEFTRPRGTRLLWGVDFNYNPLCGVYAYEQGDEIYVFDELYQEDSNTFKAAKETRERFPESTEVIPDSTGNKMQTSATKTDHEILRRTPGFTVVGVKNPAVKDRHNNLNRLFHHKKLWIHPNCKKLIVDLEQLVHDNTDPMLSHISDALGYLAWKKLPLRRVRREATVSFG